MTRLTTVADAQAAARRAAQELARLLQESLERRGSAHIALAGGSTPRAAYELLAGLVEDWSAIELWYGDERCVGPDDPESNHRLVAESLLSRISGAPPREHRIRGELGAEEAASSYERKLRSRVPTAEIAHSRVPPANGSRSAGAVPVLDVALLGIGEDGHTASLFPGHPEVSDESGALCLPVHDAPKPPPDRVTLSIAVLRAARHGMLLATGSAKAEALTAALTGPDPRVPASLLASDRLHVVADDAAAPPSVRAGHSED
jgi:6-phosphogluconolactonase